MASNKVIFTTESIRIATVLAQEFNNIVELRKNFFDSGYDAAGSDPIVDGDISMLNRTAANVVDLITLAEQAGNFIDNAVVTQADYGSTLNNMRNDF